MIKIDKNVPMPELSVGRKDKYPLKDMGIGDSCAVKFDDHGKPLNLQRNIHSAYRHYKLEHNLRQRKIRVMVDKTKKEVRCWRIK